MLADGNFDDTVRRIRYAQSEADEVGVRDVMGSAGDHVQRVLARVGEQPSAYLG